MTTNKYIDISGPHDEFWFWKDNGEFIGREVEQGEAMGGRKPSTEELTALERMIVEASEQVETEKGGA